MSMQYQQTAWSLNDLFTSSDSPEIKATFASLDQLIGEFEKQRDILDAGMPVESLLELIRQYEVINAQASRIYSYAGLRFAADTQDQIRPEGPDDAGALHARRPPRHPEFVPLLLDVPKDTGQTLHLRGGFF